MVSAGIRNTVESRGKEGKITEFRNKFVRSHAFCNLINLFSSLSPVLIPHIVVKWVRPVPFPTFATLLPSSQYSPSHFILSRSYSTTPFHHSYSRLNPLLFCLLILPFALSFSFIIRSMGLLSAISTYCGLFQIITLPERL
jgi:hypothetical protein